MLLCLLFFGRGGESWYLLICGNLFRHSVLSINFVMFLIVFIRFPVIRSPVLSSVFPYISSLWFENAMQSHIMWHWVSTGYLVILCITG